MFYYSNEIVFRGHPDKICDQISDALLDAYLKGDPYSRCGIETVGGKGKIFITGEVTSKSNVDVESVTKRVLKDIGVTKDYEIINNIGLQSPDIAQGVDVGGAGDQGMMFGYACSETPQYIPKAMAILQEVSKVYDSLVHKYPNDFYPDGKAQITGCYDENFRLQSIKTFTLSYQNSETRRDWTDAMLRDHIQRICQNHEVAINQFLINPTGKFEIGGFDGDAGLTGRKIVVDSYQSFAPVGGGAFSGKDPSKVDRSAAYKARQLAIRALREFNLTWCQIQLSYAIGVAQPLAIYIKSNKGTLEVPQSWYDECTPSNMINEFDLRTPKFEKTAQFGHFGWSEFAWEK